MEVGTAVFIVGVIWLMVVSRGFRFVGLADAQVVLAFAWSERSEQERVC